MARAGVREVVRARVRRAVVAADRRRRDGSGGRRGRRGMCVVFCKIQRILEVDER